VKAAKQALAALVALAVYSTRVLPRVRQELKRQRPLPHAKALNVEAVSVFATLAPREARPTVVRAIVALQVAIDLRDEVEESDGGSPDARARIDGLETAWKREVAALPAHEAVLPLLERAVERCRQGQLHTHLAAREGPEPLRRWASGLDAPAGYHWWEVAAGASSSVAAHALIAAAADPRTSAKTAALIDAAYHPPVGALTVFLDDLVDFEADRATGEHNYLAYYESPGAAADRLASIASQADALLGSLPRASRHQAILAGIAAYYLGSAVSGEMSYALSIRERLLGSLGPGTRLLAIFTRIRRFGGRKRSEQAGSLPGP
jgi:tetraprenyl-beta-curcumene synthase